MAAILSRPQCVKEEWRQMDHDHITTAPPCIFSYHYRDVRIMKITILMRSPYWWDSIFLYLSRPDNVILSVWVFITAIRAYRVLAHLKNRECSQRTEYNSTIQWRTSNLKYIHGCAYVEWLDISLDNDLVPDIGSRFFVCEFEFLDLTSLQHLNVFIQEMLFYFTVCSRFLPA